MEQYSELCPFHYLDTSYMKPFKRLGAITVEVFLEQLKESQVFRAPMLETKEKSKQEFFNANLMY